MTVETEDLLENLFSDTKLNAMLAWPFVGFFGLVFLESALDGDLLWMIFTAAAGVLILLPPLYRGSIRVMLPWELLALASVPVLVRALEISALANTFATYLSIAAFALILTVELHVLNRVRVTHWFAVSFVVLATLAVAGAWTIVQWNLDRTLGTTFLTTNEALMIEYIWVTLAGLAAGVLFDLYFRPRSRRLRARLGSVVRR